MSKTVRFTCLKHFNLGNFVSFFSNPCLFFQIYIYRIFQFWQFCLFFPILSLLSNLHNECLRRHHKQWLLRCVSLPRAYNCHVPQITAMIHQITSMIRAIFRILLWVCRYLCKRIFCKSVFLRSLRFTLSPGGLGQFFS